VGEPSVTIVVVPRERFSQIGRSLESLYRHTDVPFELVVVDGGSPRRFRDYLRGESSRRGFKLVRRNHFLSPNRARNLGLHHVRTPYVVFADNDLEYTPRWLGPLVRCAEETGAWIVGPVYLEGPAKDEVVHVAGGFLSLTGEFGNRRFEEQHTGIHGKLSELPDPPRRQPCDFAEFHCLLARTERVRQVGGMDERLLSLHEHIDLCLRVREAGGEVYSEPESKVAYSGPPPLAWADFPYYMLRWSEVWNRASDEHFARKYGVGSGYVDPSRRQDHRRRRVLQPIRDALDRRLGRWASYPFGWAMHRVEPVVNRFLFRRTDPG
jgi:GT2 family glycosyltransferase